VGGKKPHPLVSQDSLPPSDSIYFSLLLLQAETELEVFLLFQVAINSFISILSNVALAPVLILLSLLHKAFSTSS